MRDEVGTFLIKKYSGLCNSVSWRWVFDKVYYFHNSFKNSYLKNIRYLFFLCFLYFDKRISFSLTSFTQFHWIYTLFLNSSLANVTKYSRLPFLLTTFCIFVFILFFCFVYVFKSKSCTFYLTLSLLAIYLRCLPYVT